MGFTIGGEREGLKEKRVTGSQLGLGPGVKERPRGVHVPLQIGGKVFSGVTTGVPRREKLLKGGVHPQIKTRGGSVQRGQH